MFRKFAEIGFAGIVIPERYDGIAAGAVVSSIVMEEIAAVDAGAAITLSVHNMVAGLTSKFGNEEQKEKYLKGFASGELLSAFALTEANAGSDAPAIAARAVKDGDKFVINGEKMYITSAGYADVYLVFAVTAEVGGKNGISAFLVDRDTPGLVVGNSEEKIGAPLSPVAVLAFQDMVVSESALLGAPNQGYLQALTALDGGRINIGAIANGLSRHALKLTLNHLMTRIQFGKPLIEFQGLQFKLADMRTDLETAQLLTWQAAQLADSKPKDPGVRICAAMAKCRATDVAMRITTEAVQLHGGMGLMKEGGVYQLMNDAKILQIVEGANEIQRAIIASEMRRGN